MFSITADGILFYDGERIGRISHSGTYPSGAIGKRMEFVARGRTVESVEGYDTLFHASIASSMAEREVQETSR